jgi:transcriptional antiterminator RfaH
MKSWFVLKTKPKKEERVLKLLKHASYELFLPKMRGIKGTKPLFPSYLFVKANLTNPYIHRKIRYTRGVNKILGSQDEPQPVSESMIETLRKQTLDGSIIEQELLFKPGDRALVKKGLLNDLIGIIEKNLCETGRVRILFKWLNKTVRATIPFTDLEKVT